MKSSRLNSQTLCFLVLGASLVSNLALAQMSPVIERTEASYRYCKGYTPLFGQNGCPMTLTNAKRFCQEYGGHLPAVEEWEVFSRSPEALADAKPGEEDSIKNMFWSSELFDGNKSSEAVYLSSSRRIGQVRINDLGEERLENLQQTDPKLAARVVSRANRAHEKVDSGLPVRCMNATRLPLAEPTARQQAVFQQSIPRCGDSRYPSVKTSLESAPVGFECENNSFVSVKTGPLSSPRYPLQVRPLRPFAYSPTVYKRYQDPTSGSLGWLDKSPMPDGRFLILYDLPSDWRQATQPKSLEDAQEYCRRLRHSLPTADQIEWAESHFVQNIMPAVTELGPSEIEQFWTSTNINEQTRDTVFYNFTYGFISKYPNPFLENVGVMCAESVSSP